MEKDKRFMTGSVRAMRLDREDPAIRGPFPKETDKPGAGGKPTVSVIIPCRNEDKFIGKCLDSILANDYPKDLLEILVVDGMSQDETRSIVSDYTRRHPFIWCLDNPKKIIPAAMNTGIRAAKGDLVTDPAP